ncbi:MAG: ATP-binding cassette domain-containing protein [Bacillota bacterium]
MHVSKAIEVSNLQKSFGSFCAVDGVSFSVSSGEIFGFLGPNGAGKTTTVRMLTGVLEPARGDIFLHGHDLREERDAAKIHIGVVPEMANAYLDLTALQNLTFTAELYGLIGPEVTKRAEELLDMFGLGERKHDRVATFSKGMVQRVILAMSLVNEPDTVFLDEPCSGLDVQGTRFMRGMIRRLNDEGITVFLTTHDIAEANELCDRVAIIHDGQIAAIDSPEKLKTTFESTRSLEIAFRERVDSFPELPSVLRTERYGDKYRLYTSDPHQTLLEITRYVETAENAKIETLNTLGPNLEEVFVHLTGGDTR